MNVTIRQLMFNGISKFTTGKNFIILMYFLLLNLGCAFAQSDFRPGFVLKSEFDTIFGEIDNKDYHSNSNFCDFKAFNSAEIRRYYPGEIYGYRFLNGKFYISRETTLPDSIVKEIFLEYLIKGELNIYFYQDAENNNIYYAEKDTSGLRELVYYVKELDISDERFEDAKKGPQDGGYYYATSGKYFYENKRYKGILTYLTKDEPGFKQQIFSIKEPSHTELIKLAKNYHELTCLDEDCIVFEKKMRNQIKFSISAGHYLITRKSILDQDPNKKIPKNSLSVALNFYISQFDRSERIFLGLGIRHEFLNQYNEELEKVKTTRIPFSVNYFHSKQGLSPIFSYAFDLRSYANLHTIMLGLNYRINKFSLFLAADIDTYKIFKVYATSQRIGIFYDFNQPNF